MKKICLLLIMCCYYFSAFALSTVSITTPTPASIFCVPETNHLCGQFQINQTTSATLITVQFTEAGTALATDITTYKLWKNSTASFAGATVISTLPGATGICSFTCSYSMPAGTTYYFITADIAPTAVGGNFLSITSGLTITVSSGGTAGVPTLLAAGGTQTYNRTPSAVTVSAVPNPLCSGAFLSLTTAVTGGSNISYEWIELGSTTSVITTTTKDTIIQMHKYKDDLSTFELIATAAGCAPVTLLTSLIHVDTLPTIYWVKVSPDTIVCTGASITLCDSAKAGAFGGDTYTWTGPGGYSYGPTISSCTPPFSVTTSGRYILAAHNHCGFAYDSTNFVKVNTVPDSVFAVATPDTLCAGSMLTLRGRIVGGSGYVVLWNGPGSFTSSSDTVSFVTTDSSSGVYTFTVVSLGCTGVSKATDSVIVNYTPVKVIASATPDTLCTRDSLTLHGSATGAYSYLWTGPMGYSSTLLNPPKIYMNSITNGGVYTLTATSPCGSKDTVTDSVFVNQTPDSIIGTTYNVCIGNTITLDDATTGGVWSSSNTSIAIVNSVGIVTGISAGTVNISYTLLGPCPSVVTITVGDNNPSPITGPKKVCVGDTILLHDLTIGGVWSSSDVTIAVVNSTDGRVAGVSAGVVNISYTTPGCNPVTYSVTVYAAPDSITGNPNLNLSICQGGTIQLNDASPGGIWISKTPSVATVNGTGVVTGLTLGIDSIYYQYPSSGCRAGVEVTVNPLPVVTITGRDTICKGSCVKIYATHYYHAQYLWSPGTGVSCTECDTFIACPLEDQTYKVVVTTNEGCKDSASRLFKVYPLPKLTFSPDPFWVCRGQVKQIEASGANSYKWFPNVRISNDSIFNPIMQMGLTHPDTFGLTYKLTGTSIYGCVDSINVPVSVIDSAITGISPDTIICYGRSTRLFAYNDKPDATYHWYRFDTATKQLFPAPWLSNDTIYNPVCTPDSTITYAVVINENVCFSKTRYVTVYVQPIPILVIGQSQNIIAGSSVNLTVNIVNFRTDTAQTWNWVPADYAVPTNQQTTTVTPTVTTVYTVTVTTRGGCSDSDTVTVHLYCDNSQVFIPNTFTPNGDGSNDLFYVSGKGLGLVTKMTIYNRWGQVMFDAAGIPANDPSYGWNGTFKGEIIPPDVFEYVITVTCEIGGQFTFHGDISLVR